MTIEELQDAIEERLQQGDVQSLMTGVRAKNVTNEILEALGFDPIPPQMVYNYMTKGYIAVTFVQGRKFVSNDDLTTWLKKYVARKVLQAS